MYLAGIISQDGSWMANSPHARSYRADGTHLCLHHVSAAVPLQITQNDVRAIQLAKAALHAGVRLLMIIWAWITSTGSASPVRSAIISTSSTRRSSG